MANTRPLPEEVVVAVAVGRSCRVIDGGGRLLGEYEAVARRCRRGCSCWPVLYRVMDGGGSRIGGPRRIRRGFCPCSLASKADGGSTLGGSVGSVGILIIMHIY